MVRRRTKVCTKRNGLLRWGEHLRERARKRQRSHCPGKVGQLLRGVAAVGHSGAAVAHQALAVRSFTSARARKVANETPGRVERERLARLLIGNAKLACGDTACLQ